GDEFGESGGLPLRGSLLDDDVLALDIPQLTESLQEVISKMGRRSNNPDWVHLIRLLRIDGWGKDKADSENDREPDQPHRHLGLGMAGGRLAERPDAPPRGAP